MQSLSLAKNNLINQEPHAKGVQLQGMQELASAISVSGSLTAADLRYNGMGSEAENMLRDCVKDRPNFDLKL